MKRIGLEFKTRWVISPHFGNWPLPVTRLVAKVQFRLPDSALTEPWEAILDTGAPLSVLPRKLWQGLDTDIHVPEATFGGISRRKVCQIRCSIGTVRGCLVDERGNHTRLYHFPAFLAKTNSVPLIIGFAGLLEKFKTSFDYEADEAWVGER